MATNKPDNIDEYISLFPPPVQEILKQIRTTIKATVPEAEETISYGMPTFTLHGNYLIYFAAYKNHIGVYPVPGGNPDFEKEFSNYTTSGRGTIQFPLNKPMPLEMIKKIVLFRVQESQQKPRKKRTKRTSTKDSKL